MTYALENALFQWREGEQRLRDAEDTERRQLESAAETVVDELRRRLGSSFLIEELAAFYAQGTDWAAELAQRYTSGTEAAYVVDAAFARYAREASDFAGGRARESHARPEAP
ncbi:MAG TPA: hypothetical protein VKB17_09220 [Thermoleophilaceae bacterium]|nr:hypothetical protein [Thermoleophilaceae bacterium]